ncbi:MAG: hypothetical protein KGI54_18830 [Pseudomonadota bacterium]|nr:hypothetical protein [Pseudomonadota bacterium]
MKTTPLIFKAENIRSLLDGTKTQTRRILSKPYINGSWSIKPSIDSRFYGHTHDWYLGDAPNPYEAIKCPHGEIGLENNNLAAAADGNGILEGLSPQTRGKPILV